jgi:hypothetical protein
MTSIINNLFSNFNDLTKTKSINDYAADYKSQKVDLYTSTPALNQGEKFKKYQRKIKKNLEKKIKRSDIEGFEGISMDNLNLKENGLANQSQEVIQNNDYSSKQQTIDNLRQQYQDTLGQYQDIVAKISGTTSGYINRVNPSNPYLGKNVCLTGGACGYVTKQGVFKWYPADNNYTYNATAGKNGCPNTAYEQITGDGDINAVGSQISSTPPLVVGTPMQPGQSCGNEGGNVFVNTLVNNPTNSFLGCYRNLPPATEVKYNPVMGSSNTANGYGCYGSSVYQNNNGAFGPWMAFDNNPNTWWHTQDSGPYTYDQANGQYVGQTVVPFVGPNGETIQGKGEFLQLNHSNLQPIPLTKYEILGRQGCCGNPNGRDPNTWYILGWNPSDQKWHQVDYQENVSFNWQMKSFTVSNPQPCGGYIILTTVVGDAHAPANTRYCLQISTWNLYTSSNYVSTSNPAMTNAGQMTFDQCSSYALSSGNQYFGLQGVDNSGVGNCMVNQSWAASAVYGNAYLYSGVPLWASNTNSSTDPGANASLDSTGALTVYNAAGTSIFQSPIEDSSNATSSSATSNGQYLGCYQDKGNSRTMITPPGDPKLSYDDCQKYAQDNNYKYFGIQNYRTNNTANHCRVGNDLAAATKYGLAKNCKTNSGVVVGGVLTYALYTLDAAETPVPYFLTLQDDGNMCVYKGTGPQDNQGGLWCTMTNGKQQEPNPNFAASKGKTGQNWMPAGTSLAPNEFIGSNDGSIYLIMQTDGNLVLYTSTKADGCSPSDAAGGKYIGQQDINALYQIDSMGNKNEIGQLAYVDQNSELHAYSSNNKQGTTNYSLVARGIDSWGNDIPGAAYSGASLESCQTSCNNNPECSGFVMNAANNICWPKTTAFYPNGNFASNSDRNIYYRAQAPITPPIGVPKTVNNIDTIAYQNYINGGDLGSQYGLANATSVQKQQLDSLQSTMNSLSSQISSLTGQFGDGSEQATTQTQTNVQGLQGYLKDMKLTDGKIKSFDTMIENILNDSDIVVLQKNYEYLFWSILAAGAVLVTMNIVKK